MMSFICVHAQYVCVGLCKLRCTESRLRIFRVGFLHTVETRQANLALSLLSTLQSECEWEEPRNGSGLTPSHSGFT